MLSHVFEVSLYGVALAGLSALLLWVLPELCLRLARSLRHGLTQIAGWIERGEEPVQGTEKSSHPLWPRISGPA